MTEADLAPDDDGPTGTGDEEARQFILQVKKIIERCLEQRMNKAEMFRVIREEELPTWIAFSVYKELREQNQDFFKEYYSMHKLKEQRENLGRLIQAHRRAGSGNAADGAHALETATMAAAAAIEPDTMAGMEWSDQQAEQDWFDGEFTHLLASSTGSGDQFAAAAALPQQQAVVHCPGGQQPHDDEQAVYNEWLREMTACAEEPVPVPVPVPTLALQQPHNNEQSVDNVMFHGVAWPHQAAAHLPAAGQQLQYQQEQAGQLPSGQQLRYHQGQPYFPADYQLQYQQEAAGQLPARQQLHYQQQDLPPWQQLHCQQQDLLAGQQLPYQQQLLYYQYQEQLLMANGGFHVAPPTGGLPSNAVMDPWPLSQDGIGWGQEQQVGAPRWPGAGAAP